jgi:ABC-type transport system involved in Fe-S cluster assembly fused permease/ATPase subunit
VREATEIVVLENGRVAERGLHADLLERDGVYARLYDMHHVAAPQTVEP